MFLKESLSRIELIGCVILFFSTILVNFESSDDDGDSSNYDSEHDGNFDENDYEQQGTNTNRILENECVDNRIRHQNSIGTTFIDGNSIDSSPVADEQ